MSEPNGSGEIVSASGSAWVLDEEDGVDDSEEETKREVSLADAEAPACAGGSVPCGSDEEDEDVDEEMRTGDPPKESESDDTNMSEALRVFEESELIACAPGLDRPVGVE